MYESLKFSQGILTFFSFQRISQRAAHAGPIAFQGESVPIFLRKTIATCDFPRVGTPVPAPSGSNE